MRFKPWFAHLVQFSASSTQSPVRRRKLQLGLEPLEDRTVPATITVTGTGEGGGTYEVIPTGPNSYNIGDLRDAISFANTNPGPDTIQFAPSIAGQTIHLTMDDINYPTDMGHTAFVITAGNIITIKGDSTKGMTIDAGGARRHFGVGLGAVLRLENLTLTGGLALGGNGGGGGGAAGNGAPGGGGAGLGGSIFVYFGTAILTNCTFTGNTALGGNGGSMLNGNDSGGGGGGTAAFNGGGPGTNGGGGGGAGMYGPGQDGNGSQGGKGGLNQKGQQAGGNATGNNGGGGGGGNISIENIPFFKVTIMHSGGPATGVNSFGFGGGGGGGAAGSGDNSFGDGHGGAGGFGAGGGGVGWPGSSDAPGGAGGFGGGGGGGVGISNGGSSLFGGGTGGSTYAGYQSGFSAGGGGGGGAGLGGAIFLNFGVLSIQNCTFTNNTATGGTGGQGEATYTSNGNYGNGLGGAIFIRNGALSQTSSTISGNNASGGGAQVYIMSQGNGQTASATFVNTVIGQSGPSTGADVVFNSIQGGSKPQITGTKNFVSTPGQFPKSALAGTGDPKLLPLADNGGPTMTMLPQLDSPLIDAGYNALRGQLLKDQRGVNRLINAFVDIGSVEVDAVKAPFLRDTVIRHDLAKMELVLTFSGPVTVSSGAFVLTLASNGRPQPVAVLVTTANGYTVVRLLGSPLLYLRHQPLKLMIDGTRLADMNGQVLQALTQQMVLNV